MMSSRAAAFRTTFIGLLLQVPLVFGWFFAVALRAVVLSRLWAWYVVPALGAPAIRPVFAFGMALLLSYATNTRVLMGKESSSTESIVLAVGSAAICLFVGYICTFFI